MKQVKIGIIGLGGRAETLLASIVALSGEVVITAACDFSQQKIDHFLGLFDKYKIKRPKAYLRHLDLLDDKNVDAVIVPTSWNSHIQIACDAMKKGKYAAIEVGGAASCDELWQLVHAAESTGVSCMMLENCCYGRNELMVMNMVRKGLFGELIYCECGYEHDLSEMGYRTDSRQERALHNMHRNGELYPTHGLGPIAKILKINRGNRFLTLTSTATKSCGFDLAARKKGINNVHFNEADIVVTNIKCANGEVITMTHGVSLPCPYSRDCRVQGTQGIWLEISKGIYIEGISPRYDKLDVAGNPYTTHEWTPIGDLYERFDHPIWQAYRNNVVGGHGGMDSLALRAFVEAVQKRTTPPIDVYDVAAWMCITCLSEQSIAMGGLPVPIPDFTNGKWVCREAEQPSKWSLNEVY